MYENVNIRSTALTTAVRTGWSTRHGPECAQTLGEVVHVGRRESRRLDVKNIDQRVDLTKDGILSVAQEGVHEAYRRCKSQIEYSNESERQTILAAAVPEIDFELAHESDIVGLDVYSCTQPSSVASNLVGEAAIYDLHECSA